jgi:nucleoside-triphosphate--adenylate kinase
VVTAVTLPLPNPNPSIEVPIEDIVARISSRWTHMASGRVYAYDYNPPKAHAHCFVVCNTTELLYSHLFSCPLLLLAKVKGKDDETGDDLVQREDDKPESVRVRLQAFAETVQPLLAHYSRQGVLRVFDGSDHPDLVAADKRTDAIYKSLKPFLVSRHTELKK